MAVFTEVQAPRKKHRKRLITFIDVTKIKHYFDIERKNFVLNFMKMKFPKQLFTVGISTSILISTAIDSASAITLNYSGRFGDTISCTIEGPPSDRRCSFEDLKGGSFSGFLELDESGARLPNIAPISYIIPIFRSWTGIY